MTKIRARIVGVSFIVAAAVMHCATQSTLTSDAGSDASSCVAGERCEVVGSSCSNLPGCSKTCTCSYSYTWECFDGGFLDCPALCPAHYHEGSPCSVKGLLCQGGDPSPPCVDVAPINCTCNGTSFSCVVDCVPFDGSVVPCPPSVTVVDGGGCTPPNPSTQCIDALGGTCTCTGGTWQCIDPTGADASDALPE